MIIKVHLHKSASQTSVLTVGSVGCSATTDAVPEVSINCAQHTTNPQILTNLAGT